jgi:hypothetical protein
MDKIKKQRKSRKVIRSTTDAPAKRKRSTAYCRTKGNNFERFVVDFYKALGYNRALSSRWGSRIMDDAKIDLCNIPFNVQCKAVEAKINYTTLTADIKTEIKKLVPEREPYPILIFHKRNRKVEVVFTLEEFEKFMRMHVPLKTIYPPPPVPKQDTEDEDSGLR